MEGIEPLPEPEFCLFDMKLYDVIIGAKLMQQLKIILIVFVIKKKIMKLMI
jgi:hypothetical protein